MLEKLFVIFIALLATGCVPPIQLTSAPTFEQVMTAEATPTKKVLRTTIINTISPNYTTRTAIKETPTPNLTDTPLSTDLPTPKLPENYEYGVYYAFLGLEAFQYGIESGLTQYPSGDLPRPPGRFNKPQAIYMAFARYKDLVTYWTDKWASFG